MTLNLKCISEKEALQLTNQNELTKRQYAFFVLGKRPVCNCPNLTGFMIKYDCGSPF